MKIIPSGQIRSLPKEISGKGQVEIGCSDSGERTRLACWFRRLAETNFVECRSTVFDFCRIVSRLYLGIAVFVLEQGQARDPVKRQVMIPNQDRS